MSSLSHSPNNSWPPAAGRQRGRGGNSPTHISATTSHEIRRRRSSCSTGFLIVLILACLLLQLNPPSVVASNPKGIFHVITQAQQSLTGEETDHRNLCDPAVGLNHRQREICQSHNNLLPTILHGYGMGLAECRYHFRTHRWNCTGHDMLLYKNGRTQKKSYLDRMTEHPTREAGFLHAITSASVSYAITKACSSGAHAQCGCDHTAQDQAALTDLLASGEGTTWEDESGTSPRAGENKPHNPGIGETKLFKWSGCSDNVHFGTAFARDFVESTEKSRLDTLMRQLRLSEQQSGGENYDDGVEDPEDPSLGSRQQRKRQRRQQRQRRGAIINLHNHNIGRAVLTKSMMIKCKCHGVSGSCETRTCWRSLPRVRHISEALYDKYRNAVRVRVTRDLRILSYDDAGGGRDGDEEEMPSDPYRRRARGGRASNAYPSGSSLSSSSMYPGRNTPQQQEVVDESLVFLKPSPSYCQASVRHGSLGTYSRQCNATTNEPRESTSCAHMCCGRGYRTQMLVQQVQCRCRFIWCCEVKCDTCMETVHVSTCN